MRGKYLLLGMLALAGVLVASPLLAQTASSSGEGFSLGDRLDQLGRKIMGGVFPKEHGPDTPPVEPRRTFSPTNNSSDSRPGNTSRTPQVVPGSPETYSTNPSLESIYGNRRPTGAYTTQHLTQPSPASSAQPGGTGTLDAMVDDSSPTAGTGSQTNRLHQRLQGFTDSAFSERMASMPKQEELPPGRQPGMAVVEKEADISDPSQLLKANRSPNSTEPPIAPTRAPVSEQQVIETTETPFRSRPAQEPSLSTSGQLQDNSARSVEAISPSGSDLPVAAGNVLFAQESPVITVRTVGPRQITVGRESTYEVNLQNSSNSPADEVVVTIDLPLWAEVLEATTSKGTASPTTTDQTRRLEWEMARLEGNGREKLALRIVPRESRPFDLAVRWGYKPGVSQAMIEVREPKLEMHLHGPRDVLYGKSEVYRLELTNTGTGEADGVEIALTPLGTDDKLPAKHKIGTLAPGEKKLIEVELTARQAGSLTVKVDAFGTGGVKAHLSEIISVRRPMLTVDIEAPDIRYVGTEAVLLVRVANPGTAAAMNLVVTAAIPPGAEYVSSQGNGKLSPDQRKVVWMQDSLAVGAEETFQLTCNLTMAGSSRLEVLSTAEGDVSASLDTTIRVESIADLKLDVSDPTGPVPVGSETMYQVRVENRGTKSADKVEVMAYFSQGIEPMSVEGGKHKIGPGQVIFDVIPSLAAGQHVTFKIKAKAGKAGNHICRVEVNCTPSGIRLASEETTHFYGTTRVSQNGSDSPADPTATSVH